MSVVARILVPLVVSLACSRNPSAVAKHDATITSVSDGPRIETKVTRVIERLEEQQKLGREKRRQLDAERGTHTKDHAPHLVNLKAASQRGFAQIWWAARYPRGQKAHPSVEIQSSVIRCAVSLSGQPEPGSESDWTDFETRIDDLPAGRYRISSPLREVTLDVP
jgi:hypothetical protein